MKLSKRKLNIVKITHAKIRNYLQTNEAEVSF